MQFVMQCRRIENAENALLTALNGAGNGRENVKSDYAFYCIFVE